MMPMLASLSSNAVRCSPAICCRKLPNAHLHQPGSQIQHGQVGKSQGLLTGLQDGLACRRFLPLKQHMALFSFLAGQGASMDIRAQSHYEASSNVCKHARLQLAVNRWPSVKISRGLSNRCVGLRQHIGASVSIRCRFSAARHLGLSSTREGTQVLRNPVQASFCLHAIVLVDSRLLRKVW